MVEKAYSGDLIEITKAIDTLYSIGDILEVESRQSDFGACDDVVLMTKEGYTVFDGEYIIHKAQARVMQHITDEQLEAVRGVYKRACNAQSGLTVDEFDGTEIQSIKAICSILKIKL